MQHLNEYRQTEHLRLTGKLFALILMAVSLPSNAAEWPKKQHTIIYKVTSHMWDSNEQKVVRTSKKVLDDIHYAFDLWQATSNGTLRFTFGGFGQPGYDSYNQIPYDGDVYLVLNGRYNHHGEMANARYSGTIPGDYKKAGIFFNKQSGSYDRNVITHEIGHVLGPALSRW